MAKKVKQENCPCGSEIPYSNCCGRYIDEGSVPPTALALMRSRYTAFTLSHEEYLLATWHSEKRPPKLDIYQDKSVKWIGLQIVRTERGTAKDDDGIVEFVARYKINGKATRLHERSRFIKENGSWYYVDGEMK